MSRTLNFVVNETQDELLRLLRFETDKRKLERLYFLFWYKSGLATTRKQISALLGRSLPAITRWIKRYLEHGLTGLLNMDYQGRKKSQTVPVETIEELVIKLETPEGFGSFHEIKEWLKEEHNIELAYSTVHRLVKYDLDASPKVARPFSEKQNPAMVEDFKENLSKPLIEIVKPCIEKYKQVRYWVQDETRISLKTGLRRRITRRGVKPRIKTTGRRIGYSLYGAVEVKTGENFFWDGDRMNQKGFEEFLKEFSEKNPLDFHVVQVDNASFHTAKKLALPDNIMLLYQPPYSPEVNPIEQVWGWLKGKMAGRLFSTLEELKSSAREILSIKDNQFFKSITHRNFILDALAKSGILK
jgi:transposase